MAFKHYDYGKLTAASYETPNDLLAELERIFFPNRVPLDPRFRNDRVNISADMPSKFDHDHEGSSLK